MQTLGRTAISFIQNYIVQAAKRIGTDLIEIAALEIGEVVSGSKKNSNCLQKMWEQKQFGINWEVKKFKCRTGRTRPLSRKSRSKSNRSRKDSFDKIK